MRLTQTRAFILIILVGLLAGATVLYAKNTTTAPARKVKVLKIQGMIGPTMADYITTNIDEVNRNLYECVIIEMDTPGGLDDSMRKIVQSIMQSSVPVVSYVWPEGARAASAGTFIVLASHVAAMAPATNIGAAHPVGMEGEKASDKITNDAVAYIRSIAERRGRNVEWAEKSVRKSESISAGEALKMKVIDLIATSPTDLLVQLDGRKVNLGTEMVTLHTRDSEVIYQEPSSVQNFFQILGHPNIAYILLILGIWGLYFELANPGMILPGVVGGLCLILGLLALSVLPVNLAGLLLILLAVILFTADLFSPTHGVLTSGGVIAFILGSLLLFNPSPYGKVPWSLIIMSTGSTAVFFTIVLWLVIRAQRSKVIVGTERMVGMTGYAQSNLSPNGVVLVNGEQWSAQSVGEPIVDGEKIVVVEVDGLTLKVKRI